MEDKSIKTPSGYEIRVNSGNIFKNNSENPKAPSFKGLVNIEGRGYDLALWRTEKGYLSVKFTEHKISHDNDGVREEYSFDHSSESEKNLKKAHESNNNEKDDFGDDIPF